MYYKSKICVILVHLQILTGYLFKLLSFFMSYCIYPDDNDTIILITIYLE